MHGARFLGVVIGGHVGVARKRLNFGGVAVTAAAIKRESGGEVTQVEDAVACNLACANSWATTATTTTTAKPGTVFVATN